MNEIRTRNLLEYLGILERLNTGGYNCHIEIKRCTESVENEMQISENKGAYISNLGITEERIKGNKEV